MAAVGVGVMAAMPTIAVRKNFFKVLLCSLVLMVMLSLHGCGCDATELQACMNKNTVGGVMCNQAYFDCYSGDGSSCCDESDVKSAMKQVHDACTTLAALTAAPVLTNHCA